MENRKLLLKSHLFLVILVLLALLSCSCSHKPTVVTSSNVSMSVGPPVPAYLFKFVVYGDTRSDPSHGDGPHQIHRDLVGKVLTFSPSLVLQTGDLVYKGTNAGDWKLFDEITAEMRNRVAFYP